MPDNNEKKPPLGVMPEYLYEDHRVRELARTISRYMENGFNSEIIPQVSSWCDELARRMKAIIQRGKQTYENQEYTVSDEGKEVIIKVILSGENINANAIAKAMHNAIVNTLKHERRS